MKKECTFEWDPKKEKNNIYKHRIGFLEAAEAFKDPKRKIIIIGAGFWRGAREYYEKQEKRP